MYCAGGSLWDAIRRLSSKGSWNWDSRLQVQRHPRRRLHTLVLTPPPLPQILADVAQGLMHMHELDPPLIHRDVKSPNILLTSSLPDARARLADLGCTKVLQMRINSLHCFPSSFVSRTRDAHTAMQGLLGRGAHDVRGHATVDGA